MDNDEVTQGMEPETENPWRSPFTLITWGFFLTCFTFNFLLLQYILPTIGGLLLYLGFRKLREVNRWFHVAWILSGMKILWQLVLLMLFATPMNVNNNMILTVIALIFQFAFLCTFRAATKTVFDKMDIEPHRDPILGLIIWTILVICCFLIPYEILLFAVIPAIIFYIVIICSLNKLGNDLGDAKDAFIEVPSMAKDGWISLVYLITCVAGVLICTVFANHIFLDASKKVEAKEDNIRTGLVQLGFPKNIITDISDEDIVQLKDAYHVGCENYDSSPKNYYDEMKVTTIFVELPDNYLYFIEYFDWENAKVNWQDGFNIESSLNGYELLDGKLLYNKDGEEYTASIPRLQCDVVTKNNIFGPNESKVIAGAVNYPLSARNQRGYIFYRARYEEGLDSLNTLFNYVHYKSPFHYPYEQVEKNLWRDKKNQYRTNYEIKGKERKKEVKAQ